MNRRELTLKWLLPAVAVLLIGYAAWQALSRQPNDAVLPPAITPAAAPNSGQSVQTGAPVTGNVAGTGLIEPSSESLDLAPALSGVVRSVSVAPGEQVLKGQVLIQLDDREALAELALREATLMTAKRQEELAHFDFKDNQVLLGLYESLADSQFISREELLRRQATARQAQARVSLAQAQQAEAAATLNAAHVRADQFTLRAPMNGTILEVRARPGQYAAAAAPGQPGQALVTMGQISSLHVRVDIDEADISRLGLNDAVGAKDSVTGSGLTVTVSPRGASEASVKGVFVRFEPLVKPKRSLNNASDERVDTRVLQLIFKLPLQTAGFFVGQQVDAYVTGLPASRP